MASWLVEKKRSEIKNGLLFYSNFQLCGDSGDVNEDDVFQFRTQWTELKDGYADKNVLNLDESRLEWKAYSKRSVVHSAESCAGSKESKDGITIVPVVNSAGGKEQLIVIGTAARPRCFKHRDPKSLNIIYEVSLFLNYV